MPWPYREGGSLRSHGRGVRGWLQEDGFRTELAMNNQLTTRFRTYFLLDAADVSALAGVFGLLHLVPYLCVHFMLTYSAPVISAEKDYHEHQWGMLLNRLPHCPLSGVNVDITESQAKLVLYPCIHFMLMSYASVFTAANAYLEHQWGMLLNRLPDCPLSGLNVDITESQAKLVLYPRIHFMLMSYASVFTAAKAYLEHQWGILLNRLLHRPLSGLNVDITESQAKLVLYPRIHFMLMSYASVFTAANAYLEHQWGILLSRLPDCPLSSSNLLERKSARHMYVYIRSKLASQTCQPLGRASPPQRCGITPFGSDFSMCTRCHCTFGNA
ncbi:unnamed protein product [Symbiodinium sp. CCMP2592]|nr:unnamed protein product [Symbiodinium sp. CCMP2592]